MNKFFKYGFMAAGISMVVGIVFALISTVIGGKIILNNSKGILGRLKDIGVWDAIDDWSIAHHGGWHLGWREEDAPTELKINGEIKDYMTIGEPGEIAAAGIKNLELTLGAGQFFIREKDEADGIISISVQGVGDCDYYTDGNTLHVESFKGNHFVGEDLSKNQIIIDIPNGSCFDEVELTCGAGVAEIDNITANELEIEVGAGEVRVNFADVTKFSSNIGAGRVETSDMAAQEVKLEVGMGECIYHGKILKELDAECDLGNMDITIEGSEKDYNYEIECAAGNIDLGGRSIAGLAAERNIDNSAPGTIELSCNMGNITVNFQE